MTYYITYIKDSIGNNYLGIKISNSTVTPYLNKLKDIEGEYDTYVKYQQNRDRGSYHITVMNVMEYNAAAKRLGMDKFNEYVNKLLKYPIDDLKMLGVGSAERSTNKAYFIVCKSDKLDGVRSTYELPEKDFHVTLGFKHKDVFGVRKNKVIDIKTPFIKLLKKEYYNDNETFEFIKNIDNFEGDETEYIEAIKINDTNMVFRCGKMCYTLSLIDGDFRIVGKWEDSDKKPRLSSNFITKIFLEKK